MRLRHYTPDDYINEVPCIYKYREHMETVTPLGMSGKHLIDEGRTLTFLLQSGRVRRTTIGGSDLTQILWAADTK